MARSIVYVPGWGCDADQYREVVGALAGAAGRQAVVDLAGAGSHAQMCDRVLEALPDEPCALVGVSMGGWVAQHAASLAGARVERLLLASTWAEMPAPFVDALRASIAELEAGPLTPAMREELLPGFSPEAREGPLPDRLLAMVMRVGREVLMDQARAMLAAPDVIGSHAGIAADTLILAGGADLAFPPPVQRRVARSLVEHDRVTVAFATLPGSGHNVPWERAEAFIAATRRWCLGDEPSGVAPSGVPAA